MYLGTQPSNLEALLRAFEADNDALPTLRGVQTFSETCPPHVRALCRRVFAIPLIDMYSAVEAGHIAVQAPGHDHYLLFAANVMAEVINDQATGSSNL